MKEPVWIPLPQLRYVKRTIVPDLSNLLGEYEVQDFKQESVLQQQWALRYEDNFNGEFFYSNHEWRDVPLEEEKG